MSFPSPAACPWSHHREDIFHMLFETRALIPRRTLQSAGAWKRHKSSACWPATCPLLELVAPHQLMFICSNIFLAISRREGPPIEGAVQSLWFLLINHICICWSSLRNRKVSVPLQVTLLKSIIAANNQSLRAHISLQSDQQFSPRWYFTYLCSLRSSSISQGLSIKWLLWHDNYLVFCPWCSVKPHLNIL